MVNRKTLVLGSLLSAAVSLGLGTSLQKCTAQTQPPPGAPVRPVGTVRTVAGESVTLTSDSGAEFTVVMQPSATVVRTAPGHKDLQGATPIALSDVKAGDRILVRASVAPDGKTVLGSSAIIITKEDIAQKQDQERADWQKRGVGGLVKSIDPGTGAITITSGLGAAAKTIVVHTTSGTVLRRYAPNSIRFDDARPAPIDQIRLGDQLRARGTRNADSNELAADEVVSGSFRNIAGTVVSTDSTGNVVEVHDLLTKKNVSVKIGPDSQLRKLPEMLAQGLARRLKGNSQQAGQASGGPSPAEPPSGAGVGGNGYGGGSGRPGGGPDFQQVLARMPAVNIADLQKGEAVMIVTTEGTTAPTAITLLSGVEPILTASPNDNRGAMLLSQWSLGSPAGDAGP